MTTQPTQVAIAGGGPVGLLIALELARHGVSSILLDRSEQPTTFPKMDVTNGRSMELFRRLGITEQLRERGVPSHFSFDTLFAAADGSAPYARWSVPSVDEQRAVISSRNDGSQPLEADQRVPQYEFEELARELVRAEPLIDFREGVSFASFRQDADGVDVTTTGATGETRFRSRYLVGADGAGSRVRQQAGIPLDDDGGMPPNFMVHFRSSDTETLQRFGQFWHYFVMGAVLISQNERDIWTFHAPLFDGAPAEGEIDPVEFVRARSGLPVRIDEVLITSTWQPRFALAERYREGRVLLAGDAAHQVFPTGGYGMNTGVGDAFDLGWKLAAVLNGWAGDGLLQSYEQERRPVAQTNRDAARQHLSVHMGVAQKSLAGATAAELAEWVTVNDGENRLDGIEFGYRYDSSPVIVHESGEAPPWREREYVASTWPGARAPSVRLADGSALFDLLGLEFTLVDFVGDAGDVADAAVERGTPVRHLVIHDANARQVWQRDYVLVRPDQHVAWRSNMKPDASAFASVLDQVTGSVTR